MSTAAPSFEEHLAREIIRSERTRMAILAGVFAAVVVIFPVFALSHRAYYMETFGSPAAGIKIVLACAALVAYELFVRWLIGRRLERVQPLPSALRYWNALIETSTPTILIALVSQYVDPVYALQGPAVFFYAIFIVLSTLRLDFRLSLFTGLVGLSISLNGGVLAPERARQPRFSFAGSPLPAQEGAPAGA